MKKSGLIVLLAVLTALSFSRCGSSAANLDTSASEQVASLTSGSISSADSSSGVAFNDNPSSSKAWFALLDRFFGQCWIQNAYAATCPTMQSTACSGAVIALNYGTAPNGCNPPGATSIAWTGTNTFTFDAPATCTAVNGGSITSMGQNHFVTMTESTAITRTAANGSYVTLDSNSSGYSSAVSGGIKITCNSADCNTGTGRTVNILGQHRALYNSAGTKLFDHTISTPTALTITGTGANRSATAGSIQVQHNLAQFTSTSTITQALTHSAGCCFPTGGQISTTFSGGSKNGTTETITFGSTCGQATVNGTAITLTHCT